MGATAQNKKPQAEKQCHVASKSRHTSQKLCKPTAGTTRWFAEHQIECSALPIACILALNLFTGPPTFQLRDLHPLHIPSFNPTFHIAQLPAKFLFLSYRDPKTGLCLKGSDDFYIVVFWVLVWTFVRAASMKWFFLPLGRLAGIRSRGALERFAEQGWGMLSATMSWSCAIYVLATSPYASKTFLLLPSDELWKGYPHFALPPLTKFYYLVIMAFWVETMLALNIEKRRNDFGQMFAHHVITILLMTTSYAANFTRVGNLILSQMDFIDILLPAAKMFRYAGFYSLADVVFGLFFLSWIVTRHIFFPMTIYSVVFDLPRITGFRWDPEAGYFLNERSHLFFCVGLIALEVLICLWMYMIARVVYKVLSGHNADDVRSDSEDSDSEDEGEGETSKPVATATAIAGTTPPTAGPNLQRRTR